MNFIRKEWFKLSLVLVVLAGLYITYQALVVIPKNETAEQTRREEMRIKHEVTETQQKEDALEQCLSDKNFTVKTNWADICLAENKLSDECHAFYTQKDAHWHYGIDEFRRLSESCNLCEPTQPQNQQFIDYVIEKSEFEEEKCYLRHQQ